MSLRQQTISAVSWTASARVANQIGQAILSVVLIRLLTPEDFGIVAMVVVFTGFATLLSNFGLGAALVQKQDLTPAHIDTVFWLNLGVGGLLTALFIAAAPWIAAFYDTPILKDVVRVSSLIFVLGAPGAVPRALLQKRMAFDELTKIEVVVLLLSGSTAIGLAFAGWGVWSLVAQGLIYQTTTSALLLVRVTWHPRWAFSFAAVRDLFQFSASLTGFNVVNYWAREADNLLIGKFIGTVGLGLYSRAYWLMLLPIRQISSVISQVMFSALSSIQEDRARVKRIYLQATSLLAFITFPLLLGLFAVAEPFVLAVFGAAWTGVIPLIQILCFAGLIQSLCNPTGWIYQSQGRTDWMMYWGLFSSSVLITGIAIGIWMGTLETVAYAYLAANVLILYPCIAIPGRLIDMSAREVGGEVIGPFACALMMVAVVKGCDLLIPAHWMPLSRLAVLVAVGACTYSLTAWLTDLRAFRAFYALVREQWQRRFAPAHAAPPQ